MKQFGKLLSLLGLTFALLISSASCQPNQGEPVEETGSAEISAVAEKITIRLCVDLFGGINDMDIRPFLNLMIEKAPETAWTYDVVPLAEPERDNYLTRLRTEILAGAGPDLFLCNCPISLIEGVFPFPKQAANNHLFLPLDDYIENARLMGWDDLFPLVMSAGKTEDGQQLLPLTYEFSMRLFDKDGPVPEIDRPMNWKQMVETRDPSVETAARAGLIFDIFGELADYDNDVPTFTEDALLDGTKDYLSLEFHEVGIPIYWSDGWFDGGTGRTLALDENGKEYFMLPSYNLAGGVTANICTFAAINRNTNYPQECFAALDYLLSREAQQKERIYQCMRGWPVHMEVGSKDFPRNSKHMSEENFSEFSLIRDQINAVKFYTPLEDTLYDILVKWHSANQTDAELEKIVHKQYTTVQMMIAES